MSSTTFASSSAPESVLVTGAAGFVGGHVVRDLAARGYRVLATDVVPPDTWVRADANVRWAQGNLLDADFVQSLVDGVDGVVHAAGTSRAKTAADDPLACVRSTVLASTVLLEAARRFVPKWFLYVSTRAIREVEDEPAGASRLMHVYAVTKRAVEELVRCYCADASIAHMVVRLSDVYGSDRDHPNKLLPQFLRRAKAGEPLVVKDTRTRFHYVHIDDVADAITQAARDLSRGARFETRELWADPGISIPDLAAVVKRLTGSHSEIAIDEPPGPPPSPSEPPMRWRLRISLPLEEGIARMIAAAK